MIDKMDQTFTFVPTKIFYIHSGLEQPMFDKFKNRVQFYSTWSDFPLEKLNNQEHWILVVDDQYADKYVPEPDLILKIATVTAHHRKSVLLLPLHNFYSKQLRSCREIVLNCQLYIFLNCPAMRSMLRTFAQQYFGNETPRFLECYDTVLSRPFAHLIYDARVETPNILRIATNFVPSIYEKEQSEKQESLAEPAREEKEERAEEKDKNEIGKKAPEKRNYRSLLDSYGPVFFVPKRLKKKSF